jgi:hypothetical protein
MHACSRCRVLLGQNRNFSNAVHPATSSDAKLPAIAMIQAFKGLTPQSLAPLAPLETDEYMQELKPEEERNDGLYEEVMSS